MVILCNTLWVPGKCIQSFVLPKAQRSLGRCACGWEDNIVMDFKELGLKGVDWIDLGEVGDKWQSVVHIVMNLWFTYQAGNFFMDN